MAAGETGQSESTAAGRPAECDAYSCGVIGRVSSDSTSICTMVFFSLLFTCSSVGLDE